MDPGSPPASLLPKVVLRTQNAVTPNKVTFGTSDIETCWVICNGVPVRVEATNYNLRREMLQTIMSGKELDVRITPHCHGEDGYGCRAKYAWSECVCMTPPGFVLAPPPSPYSDDVGTLYTGSSFPTYYDGPLDLLNYNPDEDDVDLW